MIPIGAVVVFVLLALGAGVLVGLALGTVHKE